MACADMESAHGVPIATIGRRDVDGGVGYGQSSGFNIAIAP